MGKKSEKMYKDSPSMERNEEGKMDVKKKPAAQEAGTEGEVREGIPADARHHMERMELHHKHQHEHHAHDHGKHGDKHEMHERHHSEMKAMHKRHEKEASGKTGEAMIDKVETDKKED